MDIRDNVFSGYGTIILPNTRIGNNVIVGAGTVVAKDIPDNVVVVGNLCQILCSYDKYISNNKEHMDRGSVFNTYFSMKSAEEKKEEFDALSTIRGI